MQTGSPANPQWVAADNKPYYVLDPKQPRRTPIASDPKSVGDRRDYRRRVRRQGRMRGLGPLGWIFCVPYDPGATYKVSLADDNSETDLVPAVTTTTTAAATAGATIIAVTSATGFVVAYPIAATGIPPGSYISAINGLNITITQQVLAGGVASGATVTVTPPGPPTVAKPPAGVK